jgi:tRNA A37 threonylcarbamoyladenosine biosynthesis protein TsaE
MRFISKSEQQTINFAKKLAKTLKGSDVLALVGDLGSGKTVFAKGLAKAFGIDCAHSPTFVLMHIHKINSDPTGHHPKGDKFQTPNSKQIPNSKFKNSKQPPLSPPVLRSEIGGVRGGLPTTLCHIDAYRLKDGDSLLEIGADEYIGNPEIITVIEWAEKVKKILPKNTKWIFFKHHPKKENWRIIKYNS